MNNSEKSKRVDQIDIQLKPRQWAIRFADEMRQYPSQLDYMKAIVEGTIQESLFMVPYYALAEQAKERWPQDTHKDAKLRSKLQAEFRAFENMIIDINKKIIINVKMTRLEAARLASENEKLIMRGMFVYTVFAEIMVTRSPTEARLRHSLELEKWAENVCMLLMEIAAYKSAVQTIQNDYFEGHAILFKEFESALDMNIEILHDAIAGFNDYRKNLADLPNRIFALGTKNAGMGNALPPEPECIVPIDIEAVEKRSELLVHYIVERWVNDAKFTGTVDLLSQTGKHVDFIWEHLQKKWNVNPEQNKESPSQI